MYLWILQMQTMKLSDIHACVIVPTYNNEKTLGRVLEKVLDFGEGREVIVVNDGSTDSTAEILSGFGNRITLLENEKNSGKGFSLRKGFLKAIELGFENAVTIDSDGQHYPEDIALMIDCALKNPGALIMGSRNMEQEGIPGKSSFGNKFSNFWFRIETGINLPDTQTGFRLYPLEKLKGMRLYTSKFELEIEVIVRMAWKKTQFIPLPVRVLYDMDERVSHFRPGPDFFRISVLNTVLVAFTLLYHLPRRLLAKNIWKLIKEEAVKPEETNFMKALSLGFGCFMGIFPIWGFQLLVGIPLSILFRMNKVLFIAAANISFPPMIPFIIYGSVLIGQKMIPGELTAKPAELFSLANIHDNFMQYLVGAVALSVIGFVVFFAVSFVLLKIFRKEPPKQAEA